MIEFRIPPARVVIPVARASNYIIVVAKEKIFKVSEADNNHTEKKIGCGSPTCW